MANYTTGPFVPCSNSSCESNETFESFWFASNEYVIFWIMKTFVPPLLVIFGCSGNIITLCIIRGHWILDSSSGIYIIQILVLHTLNLLSGCALEWVLYISEQPLPANVNDCLCRVSQFVLHILTSSPTWLHLLLLVDRTLYVCRPSYRASLCTVHSARVMTTAMYVGLVTLNVHAMWTYELEPGGRCNIAPRQHVFYAAVYPWIAASFNIYIPTLLILIFLFLHAIRTCVADWPELLSSQQHVHLAVSHSLTFLTFSSPSIIINIIHYSTTWFSTYQSFAVLYTMTEGFQMLVWLNQSLTHALCMFTVPQLKINFSRLFVKVGHEHTYHDGMLMAYGAISPPRHAVTAV